MQRKNLHYEITNKKEDTKSVDILIYDSIPKFESDTWRMVNTASQFVKDFKNLEKQYDRINIHINSPGGSVYHGFPMFNVIANSEKDTHTYNDGLAASMGGILLLAGKTVHTAKNALLMIHTTNGIAIGNSEDFREVANMMDKYNGIIAEHLSAKSGQDLEDIKSKYINYKDHWLTAQEALDEGFVNQIDDYESVNPPPKNIQNMSMTEIMAHYSDTDSKEKEAAEERGFMQRVVAHVKETLNLKPKINTPDKKQTNRNQNNSNMDFKNSLALLEKETISPEDIAAIKAEIKNFTGENEKFTSTEVQARVDDAVAPLNQELTDLKTEKTNLETEVSNLKTEKTNLSTDKDNLTTENAGLKKDIEAYRKSGVKITGSQGKDPDPIDDEDKEPYNYSETDAEIKAMRAEAGFSSEN
ncbi:head maturation protease, ClpP-related [Cyclobacterium marinum]|uniref:ATP-dependent Clp protease proteolytic subunit n=1 Tax=Cyclobacterium marinum (strain ATCC 25205 / DSM 745 / LMG 13164 / NCIMB 1802) TaxID=880070 RepID=G0J392_CYCMS|nr:head maturation protease, ClpP-related [Cyclobacterium marinum]AEL24033.1 peptidase S14 ClpP [Cyclobacterium marinum DSM 745]